MSVDHFEPKGYTLRSRHSCGATVIVKSTSERGDLPEATIVPLLAGDYVSAVPLYPS